MKATVKTRLPIPLLAASCALLIALDCAAADPPRAASAAHAGKTAGSLSGPAAPDCAALRKRYAASQACFAPYRLANGGMKPQAFKKCHDMPDPALTCGPATVSP